MTQTAGQVGTTATTSPSAKNVAQVVQDWGPLIYTLPNAEAARGFIDSHQWEPFGDDKVPE